MRRLAASRTMSSRIAPRDRKLAPISGDRSTICVAALLLALAGPGGAVAATASVHYGYDQLGRVVTAQYDNSVCVVYAYDPNGNRTAQTNTSNSTPETPTWGSGVWGCFNWAAQHVELDDHARFSAQGAGYGGKSGR